MKPLRVALIVKGSASTRRRLDRNMGYWSYPVPEFTWEHFYLGEQFVCDTRRFVGQGFDLIFHEDAGNWGRYTGDSIPVVYMVIDSTLSNPHYQVRKRQAAQADLVLVDHDHLYRFNSSGKPVRRLSYCVNDRIFEPNGDKAIDIAYHCSSGARKGHPGGTERNELRRYLHDICERNRYSYRSGVLGLRKYAQSMGESRIVVNLPRTVINRPHRVLDAMACKACVVTGPLPNVEEDLRIEGKHYVEFESNDDLPGLFDRLLDNGEWEQIAEAGHDLVMSNHTWAIRAQQLREMLHKEFGL